MHALRPATLRVRGAGCWRLGVVWGLLACGILGDEGCGSSGGTPGPGDLPGTGGGGRGGRGGSGPSPADAASAGGGHAGAAGPGAGGAAGGAETGDGSAPPEDVAGGGAAGSGSLPDAESTVPPAPGACAKLLAGAGPQSEWVHWDGEGKLVYKPLNPQGDRMMDFSHAGYHGGGVALPTLPVAALVAPSGGDDDSAAIQAAIDQVSQRPLLGGVRGAVLLGPGVFKTAAAVTIGASGVVLRGSGAGMGGTEIQLIGANHRFLIIQGAGTRMVDSASATGITDDHVPAGTRSFTVASPAAFKVGDQVLIGRPVTAPWVTFMGMDKLVRNGLPQTWLKVGSVISAERVITAMAGNKITVDIPLSDSMAGEHVKPPGGTMTKYTFDRLSEIGVEHLKVVGQPRSATVSFSFVQINTVVDAWVKDVIAHDVTTGVGANGDAKRITVEDTTISHTMVDYVSAAKPSDFNIDASEVLIHRSASHGSNRSFSFVTESGVPGPTVVLNFDVSGISPPIQPHQRWATGLLVDNATLADGSIDLIDRNILGSGHGWTIGWGVVWNSSAASLHIQQPPGSMNWAIGCKGAQGAASDGHPNGIFESHGTPVAMKSLYLAQLCERLGPQALANIGYR